MAENMYLADAWIFVNSSIWNIFQRFQKRERRDGTVCAVFDSCACGDEFMRKRKEVDGFVTVEYTLLIPVLLILYTFLICIGLYQYNQCILRTNIYLLASEGAGLSNVGAASKIVQLQDIEERLYHDKYLLVDEMQTAYSVRGNHIEIRGSGNMLNSLAVWGIGEKRWNLSAVCEVEAIDAVETLRACKIIRNTLQETLEKEEQSNDS